MKKLFKIFLAFAMIFGVLQIQNVEAEEYYATLKNFNLKNYQEVNEITAGTQLPLEYEIETNIPEDYFGYNIFTYFKAPDGSIVSLSIVDKMLLTEERYKYYYTDLEFLFVKVATYNNDVWSDEYYSPYTLGTILETVNNSPNPEDYNWYCPELNETTYNQLDIQPFKIKFTDYQEVNNPDITSIQLEQNESEFELTFTTSEVKKGDYSAADLRLQCNDEIYGEDNFYLGFYDIEYLGIIDEKPTYKAKMKLESTYVYNIYGDYYLCEFTVGDYAEQVKSADASMISNFNDIKMAFNENVNIIEKITEEDIVCPELFYRIDGYFPSPRLEFEYEGKTYPLQIEYVYDEEGNEIWFGTTNGFDIDPMIPQTHSRTVICEYRVAVGITRKVKVNFVVTLYDENGLGNLVDYEKNFEICVKREDVVNEYGKFDATNYPFKVPVLLNDGTYTETTVEFGPGDNILIQDENCPYGWVRGMFFVPDQYNPYKVQLTYRIYMQDDNGNLVDEDGNVIVKYEDREDINHESNNNAVSVTSLEGSVPTYTTVDAVEENVDDIFEEESIAYDITLNADYNTIQPVDDVEVSIDLPENLQDKEVEVYYVDDEGNAELLESTSNGETVTFETDHFSTYAIVEKKVDDTTTPDDGEDEQEPGNNDTVEPDNPTDDTVNKDDQTTKDPTDSEDNKGNEGKEETDKPNTPETGDTYHIVYYIVLLVISIYAIIVLKRKQLFDK